MINNYENMIIVVFGGKYQVHISNKQKHVSFGKSYLQLILTVSARQFQHLVFHLMMNTPSSVNETTAPSCKSSGVCVSQH